MNDLAKAIAIASKAHEHQQDKQGAPYILHPLRVMLALRNDGLSEIHQIVGVLHDVVEDTSITIEGIVFDFGITVGESVKALTRLHGTNYLDHIRAMRSYPIAVEVKKRDLTDNTDFRRFFHGAGYERYAKAMGILLGQVD